MEKRTVSKANKGCDGAFSEFPGLATRGLGMGIAEIIPGVSGGTIAYITGIYIRLLDAIKSVNGDVLRALLHFDLRGILQQVHWRFLLMLGIGQFTGMILCTKIIPLPTLLETHPEPILGLFFGLIVASVILLARQGGLPDVGGVAFYVLGAAIGYVVVTSVSAETPEAPWFIFVCGLIAICSWLLPGISGSYVLLLLKKYQHVINGIFMSNGQPLMENIFYIALPFVAGAFIGIAVASRVLSKFIHTYEQQATMAMTGLLAVTLYAIYPFQSYIKEIIMLHEMPREKIVGSVPYVPTAEQLLTPSGLLAIGLMIAGSLLVLYVDAMARKHKALSR